MADDENLRGADENESEESAAQRGNMRFQDADSTTPREPTLAEQRARIAAERRREEQRAAELAAAESRTQNRRRVMVGSGVTVGVVALVAAFYSGAAYSAEKNAVTQFCATEQGGQAIAQDANLCDEDYVTSHHGYSSGGMFFMPIFLPGGAIGGHTPYRYSYTAPGVPAPSPGSTVTNPNFNKPSNANIKDTKGKTISRGGFGIGNKSGSGGS